MTTPRTLPTDDDIRALIQRRLTTPDRMVVVKWRQFGHDEQTSVPMPRLVALYIEEELSEMGIAAKVVDV